MIFGSGDGVRLLFGVLAYFAAITGLLAAGFVGIRSIAPPDWSATASSSSEALVPSHDLPDRFRGQRAKIVPIRPTDEPLYPAIAPSRPAGGIPPYAAMAKKKAQANFAGEKAKRRGKAGSSGEGMDAFGQALPAAPVRQPADRMTVY
jgi:hypothetical protein